jgi:hypothetical protein
VAEASFVSLAVVMGVAFVTPLVVGLVPWLEVPSVVLETVLALIAGGLLSALVFPVPALPLLRGGDPEPIVTTPPRIPGHVT